MEELCTQLVPFGSFFRPHRSFLVNFAYVQSLSFRAIILSCGAQIPIPRGKYNEIKTAFKPPYSPNIRKLLEVILDEL